MPYVPRNQSDVQDRDLLEKYLPELEECNTLTGKLTKLKTLLSLSSSSLKERYIICQKIHKHLLPYYPKGSVYMYGSSENGFGIEGCDLDLLFLPFPGYSKLGMEKEPEEPIPNLKLIQTGEVSAGVLLTMGEKRQLKFVQRVLSRSGFGRISFIPAKCPILNFVGQGQHSFINCDLSCRNSLVVHNTDLLLFFGRMDDRVRPLVIALRYWGKCMGFIKPGALSAYAFTLLVIFFLQSVDQPILPPVQFLVEMAECSCVVAGWDVGITEDICDIPPSPNTNSLSELFLLFTQFYWNFDFARNAVSVRYATVLPKKSLKESSIKGIKELEESYICIQDPFNLSHNVSNGVKHDGMPLFKPALLVLSRKLQRLRAEVSNAEFRSLFDDTETMEEVESSFNLKTERCSSFQITLDNNIIVPLGDGINFMKMWYKRLCDTIFEVLQFGLLMECEVINKSPFLDLDPGMVSSKQDTGSDTYHCLLTIQCAVYDRVWGNRKKFEGKTELDSDAEELSNAVLKTEHMISKSLIANNELLSCPKPLLFFLLDCYKCEHPQMPHLYVKLTPLMETKEFKKVCNFLEKYLPKTAAKMLSN